VDLIKLALVALLALALVALVAALVSFTDLSDTAHTAWVQFVDAGGSGDETPLRTPGAAVRALFVDGVVGATHWSVMTGFVKAVITAILAWLTFVLIRKVLA